MLLTWDVTSATDAKNYYAASVSPGADSSRQDYYSEGQESPGRFGGKLAERLGLRASSVDKETFDRLCDNLAPDEGRTAHAAHQRVAAGLQRPDLLRPQILLDHRGVRQRRGTQAPAASLR